MPASSAWRLFVAAPMPAAAAEEAAHAMAALRARHPDARWLPPHKLHLTLVFLGSTAPSELPRLVHAVDRVAAAHESFEAVTGEGGGRVKDRRDGVCWLRLAQGGRETAQLALDLDEALGSSTYDARRAPHPHLTLARHVDADALEDVKLTSRGLELRWTVDRIVLFRSHTDPGGSIYEELHSSPLGA